MSKLKVIAIVFTVDVIVVAGVIFAIAHHLQDSQKAAINAHNAATTLGQTQIQQLDRKFMGNTQPVIFNNNAVAPANASIALGMSVKWQNIDKTAHQIIFDKGPAHADNSPAIGSGGMYTFTPTAKGTYHYHDGLHPALQGEVIVQ